MIIEEHVWTKWHYKNRKHYESLGYEYTGQNSELLVRSTELLKNSVVKIQAQCDICNKIRILPRNDYSAHCKDCMPKVVSKVKNDFFSDKENSLNLRQKLSEAHKNKFINNPDLIRKCRENAKKDYHLKLGTKENREKASERCKKYNTGKFGSAHQAYNHNLTDSERSAKRSYTEYYQWQNDIFSRDNGICQCCLNVFKNATGTRCHHLDGYSWCIDRRHDINNGVLLCDQCHKEFHKIYGVKKVFEWQFYEWMSANCMVNFNSLTEILKFNKQYVK